MQLPLRQGRSCGEHDLPPWCPPQPSVGSTRTAVRVRQRRLSPPTMQLLGFTCSEMTKMLCPDLSFINNIQGHHYAKPWVRRPSYRSVADNTDPPPPRPESLAHTAGSKPSSLVGERRVRLKHTENAAQATQYMMAGFPATGVRAIQRRERSFW